MKSNIKIREIQRDIKWSGEIQRTCLQQGLHFSLLSYCRTKYDNQNKVTKHILKLFGSDVYSRDTTSAFILSESQVHYSFFLVYNNMLHFYLFDFCMLHYVSNTTNTNQNVNNRINMFQYTVNSSSLQHIFYFSLKL